MKLLMVVFGLCLAFCGSTANASFLNTGTSTVGGRSAQYAVWKEDGSGTLGLSGVTVAAGSYAYIYQVLYPAQPSVGNFRVLVDSSLVTSAQVVTGLAFNSPTTFGSDSTLRPTSLLGIFADSVRFDITPSVNDNTGNQSRNFQSQLMIVISKFAPGVGQVQFRGQNTVESAGSIVPVPLPASFALLALGLPFVGAFRRKLAR